MTIAKLFLTGIAAITISSAALAEDQTTGQIVKIDQASGKITLKHRQGGTAGAGNSAMLVDEYKMQQGLALDGLKVGDPVTFTEGQVGGVWTVTGIQKQ